MLDALTAGLVANLEAVLPADWKVIDADEQSARALGVVLYYEQGDVVTTINGGPIALNHVGVEYTLTLAAPEEDPAKGRVRVTQALLDLLPALDAMPLLAWDTASRVVLTTGENCYRLNVVHLCRYANPTSITEPDPEPDPMPEEA
jgi:hypothetical protein